MHNCRVWGSENAHGLKAHECDSQKVQFYEKQSYRSFLFLRTYGDW
jgi:hypothetical protein